MADIQTLKGKITSTIYPNGKGAINAADHQALLLDVADTIADVQDGVSELSQTTDAKLTQLETTTNTKLTELSEKTTQIINDFYGSKTLTGEITQAYNNTIASFNLDGGVKYSINLTFEALAEGYVFPRLFSLDGVQLTFGTMLAGKDAFLIEYTPSEDMEVELRVNIGNDNPNLVKTQVQIVIETGTSILERLEKVEDSTTEIKEELVEDIAEIKAVLFGKESFVGAAMAKGINVLAKLKLKASINYSINLTFEALAEGYVFPRLFSLDGVQLTSGTMLAGKDAFLIEYTPSEDMEVELRVNIGNDNPNLVGTQCHVVVDTGKTIEERLAKVEGATGIPYVISKTITI